MRTVLCGQAVSTPGYASAFFSSPLPSPDSACFDKSEWTLFPLTSAPSFLPRRAAMSTQQGTLRLPPPPPPPKPLHLTMSLRGTSEAKKASSSRPMPTWSQDDATIRLGRPSEDPDDDNDSVISGREEWTTARSRMVGPTLEDLFRNEGGGGYRVRRAEVEQKGEGEGLSRLRAGARDGQEA